MPYVGSLQTCMNSRPSKVSKQKHKPAVRLFCRAALSSGECILPRAVLHCLGVGSLQTCMNSRSSKVSKQKHKPSVRLFCRAALSGGDCILPRAVLHCLSVGSLQICMNSRSSKVSKQKQKPAVRLFCRAALSSSSCVGSPPTCMKTNLGVTVATQCPLSAWFAEQHSVRLQPSEQTKKWAQLPDQTTLF